MRTTLMVDDDVLAAARALAAQRGQSIGKVISDLARQALAPVQAAGERNGVPLFPLRPDARPVTMELVNKLREELE